MDLTWIFGGATLLGLLFQVLNVFSEYKSIRNGISLVVLGVFLGSLIGAINPNSISIALKVTWLPVLLISLGLVVLVCVFCAEFRKSQSNDGLIGLAVAAGILFFFTLIFSPLISGPMSDSIHEEKYSIEELTALKNFNVERKNYDRALKVLNRIKYAMPVNDSRRAKVDEEIKLIEAKQIEYSFCQVDNYLKPSHRGEIPLNKTHVQTN